MAQNLVSIIFDALTPDLIARIASALGLDRGAAQKAVGGAVPALLAALTGAVAKPEGARRLLDAVNQTDPGVVANLSKALDGPGYKGLAEQGGGLLSSLLGGSTQSAIASAIGKFAGVDERSSSSLLGVLAPVVLGTLGKQRAASNLDASGLADLLSSQKANISAALPAGLSRLLEGENVLEGLVQRPAAAARTTTEAAARQVTEKRSSFNWLTWLIPLIALLGLAWYFLTPRAPQPTEPAATTTQPATPPAASLTVDGVDLGSSVTTAIDGLKATLEGITDAATAQTALPKLQEANATLGEIGGSVGKLQAEQKTAFAALVAAALPAINALFDKVLAIPGVSDVVKPAIDPLRAQLDTLAKG